MIPSLFVGVGEQGRQVARLAREELREAFPQLLPAVRIIGVRAQEEGPTGGPGATGPGPDGSGRAPDPPEDLLLDARPEAWAEAAGGTVREAIHGLIADWLAAATLQSVPSLAAGDCDILTVAALEEPAGASLALTAARAVREELSRFNAALAARAELLLLLPQGDSTAGARVHAALQELAGAKRAAGWEIAYLVCPSNGSVLTLREADLHGMCARFLALRTASELARRLRGPGFAFGGDGRLGSFGLSILHFPARALIRRWSRRYGQRLVTDGLLRPALDREAASAAAERYAVAQGLTFKAREAPAARGGGPVPGRALPARRQAELAALERLETWKTPAGERRVEDELTIGAFIRDEVPPARWHIALATFDAYFRAERIERLVRIVEANGAAMRAEMTEALRREVDRVVEGSRDPDNALAFLAALNGIVEETRKRLFAVRDVNRAAAGGAGGNLDAELTALRDAVASIPRWPPIAVKATLLTLLAALPAQILLNAFALSHGAVAAWLTAPVQWAGAILLAGTPAALAGWRARQRAIRKAHEQVGGCERLIEENGKARLREKARQELQLALDTLRQLTLDTKSLAREGVDPAAPNECREVEGLKQKLAAIPALLGEETEDPTSPALIDVTGYLPRPPVFHYQQNPDFSAWPGEAERLAREGFFQGWRGVTPPELAERAARFALAGVAYIDEFSLNRLVDEELPEGNAGAQALTELYNRMHRASHPFVLARPDHMVVLPRPIPAMEQPEQNALRARLEALGGGLRDVMAQAVAYEQRHQFALLQLAHHLDLEDLLALPQWRRAAGRTPVSEGEPAARRATG